MKTTSLETEHKNGKVFLCSYIYNSSFQEPKPSLQSIKNYILNNTTLSSAADIVYWNDARVNQELLLKAWTHKSFVHENIFTANESYERLEFLGDSIFGHYVSSCLYSKFPNEKEGRLSKLKNQLVSGEVMAQIAKSIGLDQLIILGKGEFQKKSFENPALISDIFESTIGALSQFLKFEELCEFLDRVVDLYEKSTGKTYFDLGRLESHEVKGQLQEFTMKHFKTLPHYESDERGDQFFVEVFIEGQKFGSFEHTSKKIAQKKCAEIALNKLTQTSKEFLC